ncbi:MAG: GAF domain-containing protein, partial [Acidobacteriales bacterium]|nr:GAF domain-containing protein [Terriglobales bacterium]
MSTSGTNPVSVGARAEAAFSNRRLSPRQKVHIPAYASFAENSSRMVLDLSEVLNISEQGMSIQTSPPLTPNRDVNLFLDLVATKAFIPAAGRVVWSDVTGRSGIHFPQMHEECRRHLRQWLVVNAIAAAGKSDPITVTTKPAELETLPNLSEPVPPAPSDYSSVLIALAAVKREVEALKSAPDAALQLIAARAQTFTRASGSAIALADVPGTQEMVCRARTGSSAPPLGMRLRVGDGFSGKCVRAGTLLSCEDSDNDPRVDRESCRALGIRSMVAAPIHARGNILGIIEVFSPQPQAFNSNDNVILERLAQIVAAVASPTPFLPGPEPVNGSQPPQETVASGAFTHAESL